MNLITRIIISLLQQVRSLLIFSPSLLAAISHFIGGWSSDYAKYSKICSDFVVRDPYPPSRPAKNSPLAFAKKLPPGKLLLPGQESIPPLPPFPPEISELQRPEDSGEGSSSMGGPSNGPSQRHGGRSLIMNNEREIINSVKSCEALHHAWFLQTSLPYALATRDLQRSGAMEECSSTAESNPGNVVRALSILNYESTSSINGSHLITKSFARKQKIY